MDRWLFGVLTGVLITSGFTKLMPLWQYYLGTTSLLVLLYCYLKPNVQPQQRTIYLILGGLFCGIGWGSGNAYLSFSQDFNDQLWQQKHKIEVIVKDIPRHTDSGIERLQFSADIVRFNEQARNGPQLQVLWYQPGAQIKPRLGERWRLWVKLKPPQGLRNQGSRLYHRYLLRHQLRGVATVQSGRRLLGHSSIRQRTFDAIGDPLRIHPLGGVLMAISLGERHYLNHAVNAVFQRTGLAHLIAISGLHLTLVGGFAAAVAQGLIKLLWARRRASREQVPARLIALWVGLGVAFLYAWFTGFAIATVRALVMWLVVVLHYTWVVRSSPSRVLLRAVVVVLIIDPLAWLDAGFWLSVVAVAVIVLMNWRWRSPQGRFRAIKSLWRLEWILTLLMLPLMLWLFHGAAVLAPLTNLVVVPLVTVWVLPLALLGAAAFSFNWSALGHGFWHLAEWPLTLIWPALEAAVEQPWHWLSHDWRGYAMVALLFWGLLQLPINRRGKRVLAGALVAVLVGVQIWQQQLGSKQLIMHVVDVGQGTAVVLEREGAALLVDTGIQFHDQGSVATSTILPLLEKRQLKPEIGFITHQDRDHIGGKADLTKAYPQLLWFGAALPEPKLKAKLESKGKRSTGCRYGQRGQWRGVHWRVLHPQVAVPHDENNRSCVLLMQFGALRMLFPGDAERLAEATLVGRHEQDIQADILLVPHHGSQTSSTEVFLKAVKPSLAIFSRARNSRYGFPHEAVVARYQKLGIFTADTARSGQLQVISDGKQWRLAQPYAAFNRAWYDRDN